MRMLILHHWNAPLTQRSDILVKLLLKSGKFDPIVLLYSGEPPVDISSRELRCAVKLPTVLPTIGILSHRGITFEPFSWLLSYGCVKTILKDISLDACWTGSLSATVLWLLLKKKGICKKFIYDDADYFPELYSMPVTDVVRILEQEVVNNADLIISVSEELASKRKRQGSKAVKVIPHGVDYKFFRKAYLTRCKRIDSNFRPKVIVFAGNLSKLLDKNVLVGMLQRVCRKIPDVTLLLVGPCEPKTLMKFRRMVAKSRVSSNVRYLGPISYLQLPEIFAESDIGLANLLSPELKFGTTGKVLQYLAAGLPVLATSIGPAFKLIQSAGVGAIGESSEDALTEAALSLLNLSYHEYVEMSSRATELARQHDWEILGQKYISQLLGVSEET